MKKTAITAGCIVVAMSLAGCAQTGMFVAGNMTNVELSEPNYKIVAIGVSGEAKASYLLGVAFSKGQEPGAVALARIGGTGQLYREAMEHLWQDFEESNGPVVGRRLALTNIRYDSDSHNLLVYSDITLSIRADVIEFTD